MIDRETVIKENAQYAFRALIDNQGVQKLMLELEEKDKKSLSGLISRLATVLAVDFAESLERSLSGKSSDGMISRLMEKIGV